MFFDGGVVAEHTPRRFFSDQSFYTTAAHRMARPLLPQAVLAEDVIAAAGGSLPPPEPDSPSGSNVTLAFSAYGLGGGRRTRQRKNRFRRDQPFIGREKSSPPLRRPLAARTKLAILLVLVCVPLTVAAGIYLLNDRRYYLISLLILIETLLPFVLSFEGRKPQPRELVVIAVLVAMGTAGRAAFFYAAPDQTGIRHCDHCRSLLRGGNRFPSGGLDWLCFQHARGAGTLDALADGGFWPDWFVGRRPCSKRLAADAIGASVCLRRPVYFFHLWGVVESSLGVDVSAPSHLADVPFRLHTGYTI